MDWFTTIITMSAITVGVVEYLKGFFPESIRDKVPSNVYRLLLCFVAVVLSFLNEGVGRNQILTGLAIAAFSQIGYGFFVKFIGDKIGDFLKKTPILPAKKEPAPVVENESLAAYMAANKGK